MKLLKNKKGMTLIETILALAVLGIVAAPLMMVFTNAAVIVKTTSDRLEINAITRIIKANVTNSVKYGVGNTIPQHNTVAEINLQDYALEPRPDGWTNLEIRGADGKVYPEYLFDAKRTKNFSDITNTADPDQKLTDTCEYLITLKTTDGKVIQKLKILVNKLDP